MRWRHYPDLALLPRAPVVVALIPNVALLPVVAALLLIVVPEWTLGTSDAAAR